MRGDRLHGFERDGVESMDHFEPLSRIDLLTVLSRPVREHVFPSICRLSFLEAIVSLYKSQTSLGDP